MAAAEPPDPHPLETLALRRFALMHEAERRVLRTAPTGRPAECGPEGYSTDAPENDPRFAATWSEDSVIRAELLRWLCLDADARKLVDPEGLRIVGAKFDARLELSFASLPFPLRFACCWLPGGIALEGADLPGLTLTRCWLGALNLVPPPEPDRMLMANNVRIKGTVNLSRSTVNGAVWLYAADIGGSLFCEGARFHKPFGRALVATAAKIGGAALFTGQFECRGNLWLYGTRVGNNLESEGARLSLGEQTVFSTNTVMLAVGATIGGIFLGNGLRAEGSVVLLRASIAGNVALNDATLCEPGGPALMAESMVVGGNFTMRRKSVAEGTVQLFAAQIAGNLEMEGASLRCPHGVALTIENATIKGSALLCRMLHDPAERFRIEGDIQMRRASIAGDLQLTGADFAPGFGGNLYAYLAKIGGSLRLQGIEYGDDSIVSFQATSCDVLVDDPDIRPQPGRLSLDGFAYRRLENPVSSESRLAWLRAQMPVGESDRRGRFRPQPYRQLAQALRAEGHDSEARQMLVGMALDRRKYAVLNRRTWLFAFLLWHTTRNGYRPLRAIMVLAVVWALGFGLFWLGDCYALMGPTDRTAFTELDQGKALSPSYPPFNPLVYAIDISLPIISLGERDKWQPLAAPLKKPAPEGYLSRNYPGLFAWLPTVLAVWRWVAIAAGWFLASMLVAGVSGLVPRE